LVAENVFDIEPVDEQDGTLNFLGVTQSLTSPFGFNGGFGTYASQQISNLNLQ
jgi:iron complex outermembrane receptor protein